MLNIHKLASDNYRHYIISKALVLAMEKMTEDADPNEQNEIKCMKSLWECEYPQFPLNYIKADDNDAQKLSA